MSRLPSKVNIFSYEITIQEVEESEMQVQDSVGYYDHEALKIVLKKSVNEDLKKVTLVHEILHACISCNNIPVYPDNIKSIISEDDWNHRAIYSLENPLTYLIKNNKQLIDYLRS